MGRRCRYRVGIDVGLYSVGLAAIEIDDSSDNPLEAMPMRVLSLMSVIHDGALDPQHKSQKRAVQSRKLVSGVARRTRRLRERRRKRYEHIDERLDEFGYPYAQAETMVTAMKGVDPYLPWHARKNLVEGYIEDEHERKLALAVAIRHIARHRGWRNPYATVQTLVEQAPTASSFYMEYFKKVQERLKDNGLDLYPGVIVVDKEDGTRVVEGTPDWENPEEGDHRPTIAELVEPFLNPKYRFRKSPDKSPAEDSDATKTVQIGKLHQSDNCYELLKIFETQRVPEEQQKALIEAIFHQVSPKEVGAAAQLVGKDDLQPNRYRASRASLAFQEYRILSTLANLRIREGRRQRRLNDDERRLLFEYLTSEEASNLATNLSWTDVSDQLGIERSDLKGVGGETEDGLPISAKRPPYLETDAILRSKVFKNKSFTRLRDWWESEADPLDKEFFLMFFDNAGVSASSLDDQELQAREHVENLLADLAMLDTDSLSALDNMKLASGRAAYSIDTLQRLNRRMLEEGLDLHEARKAEFGVGDDWKPKPEKLGTPTGNPAVDRTIKIVSRWLLACEREWGAPETIAIEHVREGFQSKKQSDKQKEEYKRTMNRRNKANDEARDRIVAAKGKREGEVITDKNTIRRSEIRKQLALQRQNCQCLYCGKPITYDTAQMDHIVPRKGPGSTNRLTNLVATCEDCNQSKNNTLFWTWATPMQRKETIERVKFWIKDSNYNQQEFRKFKNDVIARLKQREEDEPLDNRSMESVAWMALELRDQIAGAFYGRDGRFAAELEGNGESEIVQRVMVYKGWITAEARRASGIEGRLPWIGDYKAKTRLDRRHHAVDAAVIAFMRPGVAKTLIERDALCREQEDLGHRGSYKQYGDFRDWEGENEGDTELYKLWRDVQMSCLQKIVADAMDEDRVVVTEPVRLRVGVGRAHKDNIRPLVKKHVGDQLSANAIDKAETPALWTALTRCPDYDPKTGLPQDPNRTIRVHDRWLHADDLIGFMADKDRKDKEKTDLDKRVDAVRACVRNGFAEIGDTIHHARFYRIPKRNSKGAVTKYEYAMLRVFQVDLNRHHHEDLFTVELPPQSISVRAAIPRLRDALSEGTAEYLGWAVTGDEIVIDQGAKLFSPEGKNKINLFMKAFPDTDRFVITGFGTNGRLTLRPRYFASEGVPKLDSNFSTDDEEIRKTIKRVYGDHDWTAADIKKIETVIEGNCPLAINQILPTHPTIIRRNTLGMERWKSNNHMPISWRVP